MQIAVTHLKNPAVGWDIDVTVTAENAETVAHVQIKVNDFPQVDEDLPENMRHWHRTLIQQGNYPGDNRVAVTATDQNGNDGAAEDQWE